MTVDASDRLQQDINLLRPPLLHCTCGTEVVSAWDDKIKRHRMFVSNPRRGQFLIRRKPVQGYVSRWEATWWGGTGGMFSVHDCDGLIVEAKVSLFGIGDAEDFLAGERMSA